MLGSTLQFCLIKLIKLSVHCNYNASVELYYTLDIYLHNTHTICCAYKKRVTNYFPRKYCQRGCGLFICFKGILIKVNEMKGQCMMQFQGWIKYQMYTYILAFKKQKQNHKVLTKVSFPDSKLFWVNIGQCLANSYTIGPMGLAIWVSSPLWYPDHGHCQALLKLMHMGMLVSN